MKNYRQPGDTVTMTSPSGGLLSGDPVVIGAVFGIAAADAAQGDEVEIVTTGVFELAKSSGVIAEGAIVWFDTSGGTIENTTLGGLFPVGVAVKAALDADATVNVRLDGVAVVAAGA